MQLTKEAKDWLTIALDPYHDYATAIEGLPDNINMRSFVRVHVSTATISATADDDKFCLYFTGLHGGATNYVASAWNLTGTTYSIAPINVLHSTSANEPSLAGYIAGTATNDAKFATTANVNLPSRVIAMGMEIQDVTQSLYKRGSITIAPLTGAIGHQSRVRTDVATHLWMEDMFVPSMKPLNLTQLVTVPNSLTYPLKDGAYIIPRLQSPQAPEKFYRGGNNIGHPYAIIENNTDGTSPTIYSYAASSADDLSDMHNVPSMAYSGFEPFMAHISGVSAETTLTIKLRTIVEYFPEADDLVNLSIATFSPIYCPAALISYFETINHLPIATKVGDNASGDWWRKVVFILKKTTPVLDFVGNITGNSIPKIISGGIKMLPKPRKVQQNAVLVRPNKRTNMPKRKQR